MIQRIFPLLAIVTICLVSTAFGQFNFNDFSDVSSLNIQGGASQQGNQLEITGEPGTGHGTAWFSTRQPIAGGFSTSFDINITNNTGTPADGVAFVIQDQSATALSVAGGGSGMGFQGLNPGALAVEFDTFGDIGVTNVVPGGAFPSAINPNSAGGTIPPGTSGPVASGLTSADGVTHTVDINYDANTQALNVDIDNSPVLSSNVDLTPFLDPDGMAFVGFAGATGGADHQARLDNWLFQPAGTAAIPEPSTYLIWSLLSIMGALFAWCRAWLKRS